MVKNPSGMEAKSIADILLAITMPRSVLRITLGVYARRTPEIRLASLANYATTSTYFSMYFFRIAF